MCNLVNKKADLITAIAIQSVLTFFSLMEVEVNLFSVQYDYSLYKIT